MSIRLAIQAHNSSYSPGATGSYTVRWMEYCRENDIEYRQVDCYRPDALSQIRDCDALLWHFAHRKPTDLLMAPHVLRAAERMGLVVFPDLQTSWFYDDKVAQKYLLEAVDAPAVPTYVFYDRSRALEWLREAEYPIVWKLRRGAGASNVRLLKGYKEAARYVRKAFTSGFAPQPGLVSDVRARMGRVTTPGDLLAKLRRLGGRFLPHRQVSRLWPREKGYVLFQSFVPGNLCDTRVSVVGHRAWAYNRAVRKGDFRASGSGLIDSDSAKVDPQCIRIAYDITRKLAVQSASYDFVKYGDGRPAIIEVSYAFGTRGARATGGYWDPDLKWRKDKVMPEDAIVELVLATVKARREGARERACL